jgi:hypothetical protein
MRLRKRREKLLAVGMCSSGTARWHKISEYIMFAAVIISGSFPIC